MKLLLVEDDAPLAAEIAKALQREADEQRSVVGEGRILAFTVDGPSGPSGITITVDGTVFHDAGAADGQEIGLAVAVVAVAVLIALHFIRAHGERAQAFQAEALKV